MGGVSPGSWDEYLLGIRGRYGKDDGRLQLRLAAGSRFCKVSCRAGFGVKKGRKGGKGMREIRAAVDGCQRSIDWSEFKEERCQR